LGLTQWFNTDSGFEFNTLFNTFAIVAWRSTGADNVLGAAGRGLAGPPATCRWQPQAVSAGEGRRGFRAGAAANNTVVAVPEMGDSITEGSVCAVLKSVGAWFAALGRSTRGQVVATVEPPGWTTRFSWQSMGTRTCRLLAPCKILASPSKPLASPSNRTRGPVERCLLQTPTGWYATGCAGDSVATDEVLVQIETDKVTIDVRAPAAGVVAGIQVRKPRNHSHEGCNRLWCETLGLPRRYIETQLILTLAHRRLRRR
jgi:YD repeat-containing protein